MNELIDYLVTKGSLCYGIVKKESRNATPDTPVTVTMEEEGNYKNRKIITSRSNNQRTSDI